MRKLGSSDSSRGRKMPVQRLQNRRTQKMADQREKRLVLRLPAIRKQDSIGKIDMASTTDQRSQTIRMQTVVGAVAEEDRVLPNTNAPNQAQVTLSALKCDRLRAGKCAKAVACMSPPVRAGKCAKAAACMSPPVNTRRRRKGAEFETRKARGKS